MRCSKAILLLQVIFIGQVAGWVNLFDQPFTFTCPLQESLYHVMSIHNNHNEDREWDFKCRAPPGDAKLGTCEWTAYVNNYDLPMTFQCPNDEIVAGVSSVHDNSHEDRRFKFYCCQVPGYKTASCQLTGYVNDWDQQMDYYAPTDKVIRGVDSYHDNGKEDRRFKFEVCSLIT